MQCEVILTAGAIRNGYITVDPRWSGFPAAMCGSKDVADGRRGLFRFPGGVEEASDLRPSGPGSARIRSRFGPLFRRLELQPGDTLLIQRTDEAQYRVDVRPGQGVDHFEQGYGRLKARVLMAMPAFGGFDSDVRMRREMAYKYALVEQFSALMRPAIEAGEPTAVWDALLRLLKIKVGEDAPVAQNVVSWRITAQLAELASDDQQAMGAALIALFAAQPVDAGVDAFNACMSSLRTPLQAASQRSLASLLLALHDPHRYCFVKTGQFGRALMMLDPGFAWERGGISEQGWMAVRNLLDRLGERLAEEGWPADDLIAVQSFLWVAMSYGQPEEDSAEDAVGSQGDAMLEAEEPMQPALPSNTLLYGPPGTGKTHAMVDRAIALLDPVLHARTRSGGAQARRQRKQRYDTLVADGRIGFVTFHQSFAYEDFVEGLKARTTASGALEYAVVPGVFVELCRRAWEAAQQSADGAAPPFLLIIDEINRGNIARIFGELITLIEPSKRAGMDEALQACLPYSREAFSVPANLHIVGTMNTADRSLAAMDVALRRRFEFVEMPPRPELLDRQVAGIHLGTVLATINARIEVLLGRDHLIGHAYLISVHDLAGLADAFANRIIPLLQEYFFEDWQRIAWVLNDHRKPEQDRFLCQQALDSQRLFGAEVDVPGDGRRWSLQHAAFERIEAYQGITAPLAG